MTRIRLFRLALIGTLALLAVSCETAPEASADSAGADSAGADSAGADSAGADSAGVAAALASYRDAWLAGDAEAVMAHISDSIILYGPGAAPVIGKAAVRAHYFPAADTTYPITRYEIRGQRIHVGGDLAVVEGRSNLGWNTVAGGAVMDSATAESDYLTVLVRDGGPWRIHRQMYVVR